MQTWQEYEADRIARRDAARAHYDAARHEAEQLELDGAEWSLISDARGRLYRAELALEAAEEAE